MPHARKPIPRPAKTARFAPVIDGRVRLDVGVFARKTDALEAARIAHAMAGGVTAVPPVDARRVWVSIDA